MIRLMIIEENESIINEIKDYFKDNKDITVLYEASSINKAVYLIRTCKDYDLILIDMSMIFKDGFSILYTMKHQNINKEVIVTSNINIPSIIKEVSGVGASSFLLKPYDYKYLEDRIMSIKGTINSNIDRRICNLLHLMGIPSHIKGYSYIKEGIYLIYDKAHSIRINEIYKVLANNNHTTISRVERTIRHAVELSFTRGDLSILEKIFGNTLSLSKSKPTNKEFIITMAEKLKNG